MNEMFAWITTKPLPVDLKCPTQEMVPEPEKYQEYELRSVWH